MTHKTTARKGWQVAALILVGLFSAQFAIGQTADEWVAAHTAHRQAVGTAPLEWNQNLAKMATDWATKIANGEGSGHRPPNPEEHRQFGVECDWNYCGENIWEGTNTGNPGVGAVGAWVRSEKDWFDASRGGCVVGSQNADGYPCTAPSCCWHYTQVVSQRSREVGCGNARSGDKWVTVCNYNPGGNYEEPPNSGILTAIYPGAGSGGGPGTGSVGGPSFKAGDLAVGDFGGWRCVKVSRVEATQVYFQFMGGSGEGNGPAFLFKTVDQAKAEGLSPRDCP